MIQKWKVNITNAFYNNVHILYREKKKVGRMKYATFVFALRNKFDIDLLLDIEN